MQILHYCNIECSLTNKQIQIILLYYCLWFMLGNIEKRTREYQSLDTDSMPQCLSYYNRGLDRAWAAPF